MSCYTEVSAVKLRHAVNLAFKNTCVAFWQEIYIYKTTVLL